MAAGTHVLDAPAPPPPRFAWLTANPGRRAGFMYFVLPMLAPFSLFYVPGKLIVSGDATATARNILASESLYRAGIAAGLASAIGFIFVVRVLYRLLSPVNRAHAGLMTTLVYMMVTIGFALTVTDLAVLTVLKGTDFLAPFTQAQREAIAYLFISVSKHGVLLAMVFWGLWLFPFGWLVLKSGFLPRILGILLLMNGVAYVVLSFTTLQFPEYASIVRRLAFPFLFGELWIILWLMIVGVPATAAIGSRPARRT